MAIIRKSPNDQRSRAVCWGFFHARAAGARTVRSMIFTPARTGRAARGFLQKKQEKPRDFKEKQPGPKTAAAREENALPGLLAFVVTRQTNSALTRR